eukprot:s158_g27.t1
MPRKKADQNNDQCLAVAFAKGASVPKAPKAGPFGPKAKAKVHAAKSKPKSNPSVLPPVPKFCSKAESKASSSSTAPYQAVPPAKRKEFAEGSKECFEKALSDEGQVESNGAKRLCLEAAIQESEKAVAEDLARAQSDQANQEHQGTGFDMDTGAGGAELGNNDAVAAAEPLKGSNQKDDDKSMGETQQSVPATGSAPEVKQCEVKPSEGEDSTGPSQEVKCKEDAKDVTKDPSASAAPIEPLAEKEDAHSSALKGESAGDDRGDLAATLPTGENAANEMPKKDDVALSAWPQGKQEEDAKDVTMEPPPAETEDEQSSGSLSAEKPAVEPLAAEKKDQDPVRVRVMIAVILVRSLRRRQTQRKDPSASAAPIEPLAEKEDAHSSALKGESAGDDREGGDLASALPPRENVANEMPRDDAEQGNGGFPANDDGASAVALAGTEPVPVDDLVSAADRYREEILQQLLEMSDESRKRELELADMHPDLHEYNTVLKERGLQELNFEGGLYMGGSGVNAAVPLSEFMTWVWEKEQCEKDDDYDEAGSGSEAESITALIEKEMNNIENGEGHSAAALLSLPLSLAL